MMGSLKTVLMGFIETLSQHFCGGTEEEYENSVRMTGAAGVPATQLRHVLAVLWRDAIVPREPVKGVSVECVPRESGTLKFWFTDP
jgi:hypothetical protein